MQRRRIRYPNANPLLAWSRLIFNTGEMLLASAQVISHRTGRLAQAGLNPNARDRREFTLMGQEKIEAAAQSAQAVAMQMMTLHMQFATLAFKQFMQGAGGIMTLAASPALVWSAKGQERLLRNVIADSAAMTSNLSGSVARLAHHGLKPIHARATGNAKRLLKV